MQFELDPDEQKRFEEWNARHLAGHHNGEEPYTGAIGGRISFVITATGLGMLCNVKCGSCERKDPNNAHFLLTDTSNW